MWFKVGETAHLKGSQTIFGKRFQYNDGLRIIEVNSKRESYLCEIDIKGEKREVELSQKEFVSPDAWAKTEELNRKIREIEGREDDE